MNLRVAVTSEVKCDDAPSRSGSETTPKSSINDYRPCTSEMLGNQTAITSENVLPRMGTRLLIRSIAAVILHNNFNIDNFYHIYSFNYSLDINPSYSTIIVDYIHKKDGSK